MALALRPYVLDGYTAFDVDEIQDAISRMFLKEYNAVRIKLGTATGHQFIVDDEKEQPWSVLLDIASIQAHGAVVQINVDAPLPIVSFTSLHLDQEYNAIGIITQDPYDQYTGTTSLLFRASARPAFMSLTDPVHGHLYLTTAELEQIQYTGDCADQVIRTHLVGAQLPRVNFKMVSHKKEYSIINYFLCHGADSWNELYGATYLKSHKHATHSFSSVRIIKNEKTRDLYCNQWKHHVTLYEQYSPYCAIMGFSHNY
jgi:hypothetical protein